ncbi:MAG: hypothetical protein HY647_08370 [Acidobacteria bacterium]|nr:hypothetical protein [Acidobacteriota bacterium]
MIQSIAILLMMDSLSGHPPQSHKDILFKIPVSAFASSRSIRQPARGLKLRSSGPLFRSAGSDATAAAQAPGLDGYGAALTNFRYLASAVWTTKQAVAAIDPTATVSERVQ